MLDTRNQRLETMHLVGTMARVTERSCPSFYVLNAF